MTLCPQSKHRRVTAARPLCANFDRMQCSKMLFNAEPEPASARPLNCLELYDHCRQQWARGGRRFPAGDRASEMSLRLAALHKLKSQSSSALQVETANLQMGR